jgi:acetylglutamate kinase
VSAEALDLQTSNQTAVLAPTVPAGTGSRPLLGFEELHKGFDRLQARYPESWKYIQRFTTEFAPHDIVMKFGGDTLDAISNNDQLQSVARDIKTMQRVGITPVIIHGGGTQIDRALRARHETSEKRDGRRITPAHHMSAVESALGDVGERIVSAINNIGGHAVAISGARLFAAELKDPEDKGSVDDLDGVVNVETRRIKQLTEAGLIPVVSCLGRLAGSETQHVNINGDIAGAALAVGLQAEKYLSVTTSGGIYKDPNVHTEETRYKQLTPVDVRQLIADGIIKGGMVVKAQMAVDLNYRGVHDVVLAHDYMQELFTDDGEGTIIHRQ